MKDHIQHDPWAQEEFIKDHIQLCHGSQEEFIKDHFGDLKAELIRDHIQHDPQEELIYICLQTVTVEATVAHLVFNPTQHVCVCVCVNFI